MTAETPIKPIGPKDLIDLDVAVVPEPAQRPSTLAELIARRPGADKIPEKRRFSFLNRFGKKPDTDKESEGDSFPFLDKVRETPPGEAFLIKKTKKEPKKPNYLFWTESFDPTELLRKASEGSEGRIVAMVIVKDRSKGVLKPTADDLNMLRTLNSGVGRIQRNVVLITAAIHRPYPQVEDLELFLMAELRGRLKALSEKGITQRDITQAAELVRLQADSSVAVGKLRDRFQNVWEFAFVPGANLNSVRAREQVRRFEHLAS